MKYTYKKENGGLSIFDSKGNKVYNEDRDGYWEKREFDSKGNRIYYEDSDGYWVKNKFDSRGNMIYWENSSGKIEDNRPKPKTITAKNTDDAIKKVKEDLK